MSFFLVLGLVLLLDIVFSSANILGVLKLVTQLGKDDIGDDRARETQKMLTQNIFDAIEKYTEFNLLREIYVVSQ